MVGAGGLAPYLVAAHRAVRPSIEHVLVWNRTAGKRVVGGEVVTVLENGARQADIICCATESTTPLTMGDWLRPGVHLDLVGSFTPDMRECDHQAVKRSCIFVDSRMFAIDQPGDLADPLKRGIIPRNKIEADLFELCRGERNFVHAPNDVTLFKNGGGAHLDLFTALHICNELGLAK